MKTENIIANISQLDLLLGASAPQDGAVNPDTYQAQEYARQEKTLQEIIQKEELDLRDYIRRKQGILQALSKMLSTAQAERQKLEQQTAAPSEGQKKREPLATTRKAL